MKTNLDSLYKTSKDLEKDGIWMEISPKTKFLVKRMGGKNSEAVQQALAKYHKPFARQLDKGTLSTEKTTEITAKVFVNACLLDWKGVEIDGKEVPFDKKTALDLLVSLPELLNDLYDQASSIENYRDDLGN